MDEMSAVEKLLALEEIKLLKAQRDRAADTKDWELYESLHAPDHVSHHDEYPAWTSAAEMIANVKNNMSELTTAHHSHTPEITFESPTRASGIWAMTGIAADSQNDPEHWSISSGYYHETYEKRDGRWLFTSRRWERSFTITSPGTL